MNLYPTSQSINRLLFSLILIVPLLISVKSSSQTITFENIDNGPYGPGSSIAVLFQPKGVFPINTVFELVLSNPDGSFGTNVIGQYRSHYTTFINGVIPVGTAASSNYKVKIIARSGTNLVTEATSSYSINIVPGAGQNGKFISIRNWSEFKPNNNDLWIWGVCSGNEQRMTIENLLSNSITIVKKNEYDTLPTFSSDVVEVLNINGTSQIFANNLRPVHYRLVVKSNQNGILSTQAYFALNNRTTGPFSAVLNTVCYAPGEAGLFQFKVDIDRTISGNAFSAYYNFPGYTYTAKWEDGTDSSRYTIQAIDAAGGIISHEYRISSCGKIVSTNSQTYYNSLGPNLKVELFRPPCNQTVNVVTPIQVFEKPVIGFSLPTRICTGSSTPITFTNTSTLGRQGPSASNGTCAPPAITYEWYVDGVLASRSVNFTSSQLTPGSHTITLEPIFDINNVYCRPDPVTKSICIESIVTPDFKVDGLDSVVSCAPKSFQAKNNTPNPTCGATTFTWQVLNESTNGIILPNAGIYTVDDISGRDPNFTFTVPGRYLISLQSSNSCGIGRTTKKVIIQNVSAVSLPPDQTYCGVKSINFSTDSRHRPTYSSSGGSNEQYQWTVTGGNFSFTNNTTATSAFPTIVFNDQTAYTVSVNFKNNCGTPQIASQKISFEAPVIVNAGADQIRCFSDTKAVLLATTSGAIDSLRWRTTGTGSFSSGTLPGTDYNISSADKSNSSLRLILRAFPTNKSCSVIEDTLALSFKPRITANNDVRTICSGATLNYAPLSNNSGATFAWASQVAAGTVSGNTASGNDNISDVLVNGGNADGRVTYLIIPSFDGCTGDTGRLEATVRPKPTVIATPDNNTICSGDSIRINLQSPQGNLTYTWTAVGTPGTSGFSNGSNVNTSAIRHRLTNTSTTQGEVTYTIIGSISGGTSTSCPGDAITIKIIVNPGPTIANAGTDQRLCDQNSFTLSGNTITNGTGKWSQLSGPALTIANPNSATTTVTGAISGAFSFLYQVTSSSGCAGSSDTVLILNRPAIVKPIASPDTTICNYTSGTVNLALSASSLSSGQTGRWTILANTTGSNPVISNPTSPTSNLSFSGKGALNLEWKLSSDGGCPPQSDTILINVFEKPSAGILSPSTGICKGNSVTVVANGTSGLISKWRIRNAPFASNTFRDTSVQATSLQLNNLEDSVQVQLIATSSGSGKGCDFSDTSLLLIPVFEPTVGGTTARDSIFCAGNVSGIVTLIGEKGTVVRWERSVDNGTSWTPIPGTTGNAQYTYSNLSVTTWFRAVIKNGPCNEALSTVTKITVVAGTGAANAGVDQNLCAAENTTLTGNNVSGAAIKWFQISGDMLAHEDSTRPSMKISGMLPGKTYSFVYEISNGICPPARDTVTIKNGLPIINDIDAKKDTVCAGVNYTVTGFDATGGDNTAVTYEWQQSADGITFTSIPNTNAKSYSLLINSSTWLRRRASIGPCISVSDTTFIYAQPAISNNTIGRDTSACINTVAPKLIGSIPSGGDGNYIYEWEKREDGVNTWSPIPGGSAKDLEPGILTKNTFFRRKVLTNNCAGPLANTSAAIKVTIRPDAIAMFSPTDTIGCPPFRLTPAIVNLRVYTEENKDYLWYINDSIIGNSSTFPGYSINKENDSVRLKLVTTSKYGCRPDSMSRIFKTYILPKPAFTLSDTSGCGPLAINIVNTSANLNLFTYRWNFGTGQQSSQVQPGTITFPSSPSFNDTTYKITLQINSTCDRVETSKTVLVKSFPKSIFTPDKSTGCSPLSVIFNNTSRGFSESYTWDFGDGTILNTINNESVKHTFTTGERKTFFVKLLARNQCGADTSVFNLVVSPNNIKLDVAINGLEKESCSPQIVRFINNSSGANSFTWNFGDGRTLNTTKNLDTIIHTYSSPGTYITRITATNGCSDTATSEKIIVNSTPQAQFDINALDFCIGDTVRVKNNSDSASSYIWDFGDGVQSTLAEPSHRYDKPGTFTISLRALRIYASGIICTDTFTRKVTVGASRLINYLVSDSIGSCLPFTVQFENPVSSSILAEWNFGDGQSGTGNKASHSYRKEGVFAVTLKASVSGGCTYLASGNVKITAPSGSFSIDNNLLCDNQSLRIQVNAINTDSILYNFGDGNKIKTTQTFVIYKYPRPGRYVPSVTLIARGCAIDLTGKDTVLVDRIDPGFAFTSEKTCGSTRMTFRDTSFSFSGKKEIRWKIGSGNEVTGSTIQQAFNLSGNYPVRMIVLSATGCSDTVTLNVPVEVNSIPITSILADSSVCTDRTFMLKGVVQSNDPISFHSWTASNGFSSNKQNTEISFSRTGTYTIRYISGTDKGCFDTTIKQIVVKQSPTVTASDDITICQGQTTSLSVRGAAKYQWAPVEGLSCSTCSNPVVSARSTTPYVVTGTNEFGCFATDTVIVKVIPPLRLSVAGQDSICIGTSTQLVASGALSYQWSPSSGLSNTTISNPVASPTNTTRYRVIGYDGFNCFTDTAYILVAIGLPVTVELGPDLVLSTGTLHPLRTTITNGPIKKWEWTPSRDLSCSNCPLPTAEIKKEITYKVDVTSSYGCKASDTVNIKVFCESAQVFIPNAFTPDNDGFNDILMVRAKGIQTIKYFRIFNRWGELVFERSNFPPNDPRYAWDGKIRGIVGAPAVYVYTADVVCENGSTYTYKGNITIIK